MITHYYSLVKPGIVYGNALTAAAGFFIAAQGHIDVKLFLAMLLGVVLIVASGCVFNNYIDRDIDAKMERTKNRALVRGLISNRAAVIFGTCLGILGAAILFIFTNVLTAIVTLFGLFVYTVLYSILSKRNTMHSTLIGAVAGAVPPVAGYTAVIHTLDYGAVILFLILFTWQMPHALSIAIRRFNDYSAASIPVTPVARGIPTAKTHILAYIAVFSLASLALTPLGLTSYRYFWTLAVLEFLWLAMSVLGFWTNNDATWARKMFLYSLILIVVFCIAASLDATFQ